MPDPIKSFQRVREKALQLKRAVDAAPEKAAQLKEAVAATTDRLRQLRSDVESTVASLRADSDGSLAETLVELDGSTDVLARAGYALVGVDMEQGLTPRVIVHLEQTSAARSEPLESLLAESAGQRLTEAILNALIRAEELEEGVHLSDLVFHGLTIHVGPIPTVRLCWRRPSAATMRTAPSPMHPVARATPSPSALPGYGAESFFQRESAACPPTPAPAGTIPGTSPDATPAPTPSRVRTPVPAAAPGTELTGDWRKDALARFKKMPDLSR